MRLATFLAALLLATAAPAQDDARRTAAQTYIDSEVQQGLIDDMLSTEGVMAQMGLVGADLPAEKMQALAAIVSEELATIRPELEDAMVEGMVETFTLAEIEALTAFYTSEEGASAMRKMNPFMAGTMQRVGPAFQEMQGNLARRLQAEMSR